MSRFHPARPRVLVGGMGEQRTLPLVARYADACNLFDIPDDGATLRRKINHLHGGRGVYFDDPDGHLIELITTPYGDTRERRLPA